MKKVLLLFALCAFTLGLCAQSTLDEIRQDKDDKTYYHRLNGDETAFGGATVSNGEVKIFRIRM